MCASDATHTTPPPRCHCRQVTTVLMDDTSGQLFTGSFDGTVRVWSCTTGQVRQGQGGGRQ